MREIVKTNDLVLQSYIEVLMRQANITMIVADQNMSMMEGSIGVFPRRIFVDRDQWERARLVLIEADLEKWITSDE